MEAPSSARLCSLGRGSLRRRPPARKRWLELVLDPGHQNGHRLLQLAPDGIDLGVELVQGQNGLGVGEVQIEGDFLGGGQGMDHIAHRADAVEGVEAVHSLGAVGHADGHPVALADAHGVVGPGRQIDALEKLPVGGDLAHEFIGGQIGELFTGGPDHLVDGLLRIGEMGRGGAIEFAPRRRGKMGHGKRSPFVTMIIQWKLSQGRGL